MQRHWTLIWLTSAKIKRRRMTLSRRPGRGHQTTGAWCCIRGSLLQLRTGRERLRNLPVAFHMNYGISPMVAMCLTDNRLLLPVTFTNKSQNRRILAQGEDERPYVVDKPCAKNRPDPLHAAPSENCCA